MNTRSSAINKRIINLLRSYTDDGIVHTQQNKHIKVVGTYNGVVRSFLLSVSPARNYEQHIRTCLNRFLISIGVNERYSKAEI
jgi:hypothetical protein|tara:strand:- start:351 stop:599 length:249 start_codon:yes stop_codon:yes gene_type:complete